MTAESSGGAAADGHGSESSDAAAHEAFPGTPVLVELPAGTALARIYDGAFYPDGASFRYFGPHLRGRWDTHPAGPPRRHDRHGVLYATTTLRCAVAEVFGDDRRLSPSPPQRLAVLALTGPLMLADTRGLAAVRLGHPAGALRARDRALTQSVARALHAGTRADGVLYEGWQTGEDSVCLWERSRPAISLLDDRSLHDPAVAVELAVLADELCFDRPGIQPGG